MQNDIDMLNNIRKTTEMGQYGINSVINYASDTELYRVLKQQQTEYDKICDAADRMLKARGISGSHVGAMAKMSTDMSAAMNMMISPTASKIAEMMIKGSTMGITKNIKNIHKSGELSDDIKSLADKLVATEQDNIEQMKKFL